MAAALVSLGLAVAPAAGATPQEAHEHYVRAVELARRGNPREAKSEFERAFELSPHYIVLFNLGKVTLELGELEESRLYFRRFLEQGGDAILPARRTEAEQAIRDIEAELARGAEPEPDPAAPPPAVPVPSAQAPAPPPPAPKALPSGPDFDELDRRVDLARRRTLAYGLGATGAGVLAAGAGLLIWNASRRADAEEQQGELARAAPASEITDDGDLARAIAHERALARNRAELDAVRDVDVIGFTATGLGAALLGTGVVLYLTSGSESGVNVQAGARWIQVSKTW